MTVQCWVGRRDTYSQNGHKIIQTLNTNGEEMTEG